MEGKKHRIVVHLPMHTEHWYSTQIPQVGEHFMHRGLEYEICSCRIEGASYVVDVRDVAHAELIPIAAA